MNHANIARALSSHRFEEVFEHLADDVTWRLVADATLHGDPDNRDSRHPL